jgi:hypothetical protein
MAISFPESRARFGREGFVVEFNNEDGSSWVGNFPSERSGACKIMWHPDGVHVLVFTEGTLWSVDPISKVAEALAGGCSTVWPLESGDLLIEQSCIYILRLGREGIAWQTSRISWDGFQNVRIESNKLVGESWSPFGDDVWIPFIVDIETGVHEGGSYDHRWSPKTKRGWWRWVLDAFIALLVSYLLFVLGMGFMPEILSFPLFD